MFFFRECYCIVILYDGAASCSRVPLHPKLAQILRGVPAQFFMMHVISKYPRTDYCTQSRQLLISACAIVTDDCTEVSVMEGLAVSSTGYADITVTIPSLRPVHSTANRVRVHIWTPTDFQLSSSTNRLSRVSNWKDLNSCGGSDRFQPVRISATASFSSGTESFVGGVYPLIASNVSAPYQGWIQDFPGGGGGGGG